MALLTEERRIRISNKNWKMKTSGLRLTSTDSCFMTEIFNFRKKRKLKSYNNLKATSTSK